MRHHCPRWYWPSGGIDCSARRVAFMFLSAPGARSALQLNRFPQRSVWQFVPNPRSPRENLRFDFIEVPVFCGGGGAQGLVLHVAVRPVAAFLVQRDGGPGSMDIITVQVSPISLVTEFLLLLRRSWSHIPPIIAVPLVRTPPHVGRSVRQVGGGLRP